MDDPGTALPPHPSQSRAAGTTHLQDEDRDEGDGEDDHHLDELAVSHTLLAGEVILQQMRGPCQASYHQPHLTGEHAKGGRHSRCRCR